MFGSILILAGTLMHVYVFWRAASVPLVNRHIPRRILIGAGLVLWGFFFIARVLGHGGTGGMAVTLELIGMSWLAVLFLTSVSLLALDLVTGFGWLLPRLANSLRGWTLVAGGILSAIAFFQGMRPPVVEDFEVRLPGLSDGMDGTVLVAMSDLHLGSLLGKRWLEARVAQVMALHPDLVVLLGDIFEGHGPPQRELLPVLGALSAPIGVWAVNGNHEFHGGGETDMLPFGEAGIQVLRNRWAEVRPGLVLVGVDDIATGRRDGKSADSVARVFAGRPPGAVILLNHKPLFAEMAANAGAGLMLSGHTHGGQIWPFGYLTRRVFPLLDGLYEVNGMKVIVCRGTGTWGPRMRLWRPAQILRVTLRVPR